MSKLLMGIDVGTSACKVALFDLEGRVISKAARSYGIYYPAPGWAEQNPLEWWEAICSAIKEVLAAAGTESGTIAGIGVGGQSWSAIPVDVKGNVLHNTPIWMDTRASDICRRVTDRVGRDRIFSVSGNLFQAAYSTPKIIWFKENRPEVYKAAHVFLQSNGYIAYRLTGKFTQDVSQGYGLHFFDMKTAEYDGGLCDELGIAVEKLPGIFPCHQIIGEVTRRAAEETGLAAGTPVAAGGLDAACATLGAGVLEAGQTQEQGGQAGGMSICLDRATGHPLLILGFHAVPGLWLLQGGTVGAGGSIRWFKQELGGFEAEQERRTGTDALKIMDREAERIAPGSNGLIFLPYLSGERSPIWDRHAKGVFFGLSYDKSRAHMIRSVLEGCAYALYHNLKTAEEAGVRADSLHSVGGAANSLLWTQIKADVTGREIKVPASDTAAALGAAILAGVGAGEYKSFGEAVTRTVEIKRTHEPDPRRHEAYAKYYELYLELYEKLRDTMAKADRI